MLIELLNITRKKIKNPLKIEDYTSTKVKSFNKWHVKPKNQNKTYTKH